MKESVIILIYKMGERKQCRKYTRLIVLYQTFKILERILANKLALNIKKLAKELFTDYR